MIIITVNGDVKAKYVRIVFLNSFSQELTRITWNYLRCVFTSDSAFRVQVSQQTLNIAAIAGWSISQLLLPAGSKQCSTAFSNISRPKYLYPPVSKFLTGILEPARLMKWCNTVCFLTHPYMNHWNKFVYCTLHDNTSVCNRSCDRCRKELPESPGSQPLWQTQTYSFYVIFHSSQRGQNVVLPFPFWNLAPLSVQISQFDF